MMDIVNYGMILAAAVVAIASPGPATLAIAGASMSQGRGYGFALAAGVLTGSYCWSMLAAFGLASIMYTHAWLFELIKYVGACYLLFLAYKSIHSAVKPQKSSVTPTHIVSKTRAYAKGVLIHLTNPKAILFFGALYSMGMPHDATMLDVFSVIALVGFVSSTIFFGYAVLFSSSKARHVYLKSRRVFESAFSIFFSVAAWKVLTSK
ncbi:LysE family translocator [Marinomonas mediterranea]|uniref:Lysine exporter protein (LYSE/YGGA) n=1 Tax=Marinomonas mediterranea (strain ATCC 700492 / JCM 21426 / NBRC 103028 / MMB-1) TaxID=717774 RepID=F2K004_MARM1|nr:LysE family translocator [Marinomonas mediterranea]ADZ92116.1 Lysine exporter protein (LYSE/YGGA) [Marinomonas mediterranea MMB-1]